MESILIHTENKEELDLIKAIASKMGFKTEVLSRSDKEDIGLVHAIQENNPTESFTLQEAIEYYKSLDKKH